MNGRGIQLLVPSRPAQVSPEDLEPVVVLLLGGIRLTEFPLEDGEVVVIGQHLVVAAVHHLPDQRILQFRRSYRGGEEEGGENEDRDSAIHSFRHSRRKERITDSLLRPYI